MDEAKLIEDFTTEELTAELLNRTNPFADISTDDLVDELRERHNVEEAQQDYSYKDYAVAIDGGDLITGTGKAIILIVRYK